MNRRGSKKTAFIYLAPAMIVILVFLYLPIILNFMNSLYEWGAVSKDVTWIGIENYKELLQDETIRIAIKNNLIFMIMSIVCQIGVSLVIAAVLENKFMRRWQSIFRTIYFIPSLLMITVTGITFKMLYSPTIGLINPLLELFGIDTSNIDILGNPESAIFGVAGASQWQFIGYTVVLFIVAMQNISDDIYEAAEIDGASGIQRFFRITVPLMKDTILINMIIVVTGAFRVYDEVYVMTNGGPGRSTQTLATYLYQVGFENDRMGYASAIAFFVFIITFILGLFQMKGYDLGED
ncbi:sugar ABC transporter permease [Massilistercora timonensis]|uniref:carbohydrate ABC transporter permease n=1 Tax=Massilistercora timonensis TaxID=2086584 RepID=UPI000D0E957E|nr:sugar ABC transporter permease [Massilistercora timonensis]